MEHCAGKSPRDRTTARKPARRPRRSGAARRVLV